MLKWGMPSPTITAVYPPMIRWTRLLDAWAQSIKYSTYADTLASIFGEYRACLEWMQTGSRLMISTQFSEDGAKALLKWVHLGEVDPVRVAEQLRDDAWGYTMLLSPDEDENDVGEQYIVLGEQWAQMMGEVMLLTCSIPKLVPHPSNEVYLREWLSYGLDLVFAYADPVDEDNSANADANSNQTGALPGQPSACKQWLRTMCLGHAWVREEVVRKILHTPEYLDEWGDVLVEELGTNPSLEFVISLIAVLEDTTEEEPQHQCLQQKVPKLYGVIEDARKLYENLYGPVPGGSSSLVEYEDFIHGRAKTIQGMLVYAGKDELLEHSSSNPSIDRLF